MFIGHQQNAHGHVEQTHREKFELQINIRKRLHPSQITDYFEASGQLNVGMELFEQ